MNLTQKGIGSVALISILAILSSAIIFNTISTNKFDPVQTKLANISAVPSPTPQLSIIPTSTPNPTPAPTPTPTILPATPSPTLQPVVTNNTPPGGGYSKQTINVEGANFPVSIVAADLNSTKVIVDTASESDCADNCPVLSLGDYIARNGAFAGINGSYFCPADYPSCNGKSNSFDTLLMNKNKHYFNSDNNVYSTVPAAIFSAGSARFVGRSLEWGRDSGVDAVIANYPLLVAGSNINFTEAPNEPKFGGKAARTFIASKGNMVYIGIVYSASMGESAKVLKALGMDSALNLDQGGSTALWYEGYKAGPGRNIPNAVLFVRR